MLEGEHRSIPWTSVAEMVVTWAAQTPAQTALIHDNETVSFNQLCRRATAVANQLKATGVGPGDRVALWAQRTPNIVCAALGAWFAGAAYVPIDPSYPETRIRSVLRLADPCVLLHDSEAGQPPALEIEPLIDVALNHGDPGPAPRPPAGTDAAYVIFTSGSTGTPRGAVIEHRSLVNYVAWCGASFTTSGSGAPLFGSMGFDHTVTSWWVPLAHGKPVEIIAGTWDQTALFAPRSARWSFVKVTPSHAKLFERLSQGDYGEVTERLLFGGEILRPELLERLRDRLTGVQLINHYGPTEATVGCCWKQFDLGDLPDQGSVPIGQPIWNSRAYVLDEGLNVVSDGDPGQLVIAGAAVARGYLDGDAGRFIDEGEIEGGEPGSRAYCTGDLVELRPDGDLVFLGRRDDQLSVGGQRVEREELRQQALAVPGVAEAAFHVVEGDVDAVQAVVVTEPGALAETVSRALRLALRRTLPPAVVPKTVEVVDSLPVSSHGKLDLTPGSRDG
ncbi:MAG: amino acid adenylation domain-containing protein [Solirubrobacterales bacterium]